MKAPAATDPASAPIMRDAPLAKERPEVAAVLLQRLIHALGTADEARSSNSGSMLPQQEPQKEDTRRRLHSGSSDDASTRFANEPAFGTLAHPTGSVMQEPAANAARSEPATRPALADELLSLLERLCSGLYVGDRSTAQQRVLLALNGALPGAAAEIVRDGAHLTIRLHARDAAAYRTLLMERDALGRTLQEHNLPNVAIEVAPVGALAHAQRE